jgi:hypothetical protein
VFADITLGKAQLVGQDERLAILAQRCPPILVERMDRHGEEAELHDSSRAARHWAASCENLATLAAPYELIYPRVRHQDF